MTGRDRHQVAGVSIRTGDQRLTAVCFAPSLSCLDFAFRPSYGQGRLLHNLVPRSLTFPPPRAREGGKVSDPGSEVAYYTVSGCSWKKLLKPLNRQSWFDREHPSCTMNESWILLLRYCMKNTYQNMRRRFAYMNWWSFFYYQSFTCLIFFNVKIEDYNVSWMSCLQWHLFLETGSKYMTVDHQILDEVWGNNNKMKIKDF